jgi:hypothetical protein
MMPILMRAAAQTSTQPPSRDDRPERWRRPKPAPLAERLVRVSLWTWLAVLLLREGADDVRQLRLRARRTAGAWWTDVEHRSHRDARRSQIGLVASRIGRGPSRPVHGDRR